MGGSFFFGGDEKVPELDGGDACISEYTKSH